MCSCQFARRCFQPEYQYAKDCIAGRPMFKNLPLISNFCCDWVVLIPPSLNTEEVQESVSVSVLLLLPYEPIFFPLRLMQMINWIRCYELGERLQSQLLCKCLLKLHVGGQNFDTLTSVTFQWSKFMEQVRISWLKVFSSQFPLLIYCTTKMANRVTNFWQFVLISTIESTLSLVRFAKNTRQWNLDKCYKIKKFAIMAVIYGQSHSQSLIVHSHTWILITIHMVLIFRLFCVKFPKVFKIFVEIKIFCRNRDSFLSENAIKVFCYVQLAKMNIIYTFVAKYCEK